MAPEPTPGGWSWLEGAPAPAADRALADAFVTCFATPPGRLVLEHLRRAFIARRVAPTASDAELRHVEGQRCAMAWLIAMATPDPADR